MRVYVTGGTGFVGSNIAKLYSDWNGFDVVVGARQPPERDLPGAFSKVDLLDGPSARKGITHEEPDLIVHSAIFNDLSGIYTDRRHAWDSYVEATRAVVDAANDLDVPVVFVSTDWVFDGTQPEATEDTPVNPVNFYGVLKALGELVTLERARKPIVARIAGVNGVHWARSEGPRTQDAGFGYFVAALVDTLSAGRLFTVWESESINVRATPSLASESAAMMLQLAQAEAYGVFHCVGGESVTRMELAKATAEVFDLDQGLLRSGPPEPGGLPPAPVPYDTSLNAYATAAAIGYRLPTVRELLSAFRRQRETGEVKPVAAA